MRPLPRLVKTVSLLAFLCVCLFLNYLKGPHFILLGFIFLDGIFAYAVAAAAIAAYLYCGFLVIKRRREAKAYLLTLSSLIMVNSIVCLGSLFFTGEEVSLFLFGLSTGNLTAYATIHLLIIVINAAIAASLVLRLSR
jgi:hypothetical protein